MSRSHPASGIVSRHLSATAFGLLAAASLGCEAPLHIQPGTAAIRITVRAEPKAGYREAVRSEYSASTGAPLSRAYERVDYSGLDDIVVWVEPEHAPDVAADPPAAIVEVGRPAAYLHRPPIHATGVAGTLVVRNVGARVERVYSVSDGNAFDLGAIDPGAEAKHVIENPGVIEVLGAARREPLAIVYVTPTPWVRRLSSGGSATFIDLPPGRCTVACWHPRLPGSSTTVELPADELVRTRLTVGVNRLPKVP